MIEDSEGIHLTKHWVLFNFQILLDQLQVIKSVSLLLNESRNVKLLLDFTVAFLDNLKLLLLLFGQAATKTASAASCMTIKLNFFTEG